ncbi:MAG: hypothetical protein M3070_13345 [Actinomycetota bacterium]|nr:hypothetical protein [Actinomycetota bacterium]
MTADRSGLLGVYLNDHLAGAMGGGELAKRLAGAHAGTSAERELVQLARDVHDDRAALVQVMRDLDIAITRWKGVLAMVAERAGRLKLNDRFLRRSPLSSVVELEAMRLGVEGKLAGWRTLLLVADAEPRLDRAGLTALVERAEQQITLLENLHRQAVADALQG